MVDVPDNRVRILLVELAEDNSTGGSHRCIVDIALHLDRALFHPVVVFHQDNIHVQELRNAGIDVHVLPGRSFPASLEPSRLKRMWRKVRVLRSRVDFLRAERIDLVHVNNAPFGGFDDWLPAARIRRIPCITHARGFPSSGAGRPARILGRYFDRVITISRAIDESWRDVGIPAEKMVQIYDGIDVEGVRARAAEQWLDVRAMLGIAGDTTLIAMVGHLRSWKGQDVLLRALALLPDDVRAGMHIVFIGGPTASEDESYIAALREITSSNGLTDSVTFAGPRRDAVAFMQASDIVVHASTSPEPFGLVVVEGMALGRAVVASELGGPSEIITNDAGLLFDPSRPQDLAGILENLHRHPELRAELGARGKQLAQTFDIGVNVRSIQRVYSELLSMPRS